ncbi:MAG TPA: response regulator [Thermoflexia bacterium]|nr:response regulator [Thermoflexia bacterium]
MTKILVAEDEKDIRELIAFTLRFAGYDVVLANNGAEALEKVDKEKPALVLLDVRMPKMTGYEVCRRLKENPETENIPVVFLSAKGQDREVQEGYESGAIDYIIKPFVPDELIAQVKRILEQTG